MIFYDIHDIDRFFASLIITVINIFIIIISISILTYDITREKNLPEKEIIRDTVYLNKKDTIYIVNTKYVYQTDTVYYKESEIDYD